MSINLQVIVIHGLNITVSKDIRNHLIEFNLNQLGSFKKSDTSITYSNGFTTFIPFKIEQPIEYTIQNKEKFVFSKEGLNIYYVEDSIDENKTRNEIEEELKENEFIENLKCDNHTVQILFTTLSDGTIIYCKNDSLKDE